MKVLHLAVGAAATAGLAALAFGAWAPAMAQKSGVTCPEGFSYCLTKDGRRVPKSNPVKNPDGSEREEVKEGDCTTVREKNASGEYRESKKCS